ncbi:hypothetical protein L1889_18410 [Paenalcaligenes niemegkensis]|uniref:hypothetical protein n=1 Tax=Paenalcaligenes niemegkensis TaxID=2895469 RepID=UPI001EE844F9|nr:hypothetical protein [Paenalcaligenes niemegkensis]MCQ9618414.1 hypothetical protein [Paenalcaligenes niemegkensis]
MRQGDTLIINDEPWDFSVIPPGATLPREHFDCPYAAGDVERDTDGKLHITLLFPHASKAPDEACFPDLIIDPADGPIALPDSMWPIPQPAPETTNEQN